MRMELKDENANDSDDFYADALKAVIDLTLQINFDPLFFLSAGFKFLKLISGDR